MIKILDAFQFENEDDYNLFCEGMDSKTALFVLETVVNKAQSVGLFDIHESHMLYHTIEKLKRGN